MTKAKRPAHPGRLKRIMMRQAKSATMDRYGAGGLPKKGGYAPKPVTLPKLKCLEGEL